MTKVSTSWLPHCLHWGLCAQWRHCPLTPDWCWRCWTESAGGGPTAALPGGSPCVAVAGRSPWLVSGGGSAPSQTHVAVGTLLPAPCSLSQLKHNVNHKICLPETLRSRQFLMSLRFNDVLYDTGLAQETGLTQDTRLAQIAKDCITSPRPKQYPRPYCTEEVPKL